MNVNVLLDKLKKDIGLNGQFKGLYNDTLLLDSIINNSLQTFNRVSGFHLTINLDIISNSWERIYVGGLLPNTDIAFRIPDMYMDRLCELGVEIKRAFLKSSRRTYAITGYSRGMKDDLLYMNGKHIQDINTQTPTVTFRAPNTIILKNHAINNLLFNTNVFPIFIECTHANNLATISKGLENWFEELCRYDIMINMYNNDLRNFKIEMGSSSVDLNLENFQSAENDRKQLLETIRQRAAYDQIVLHK